MLATAWTAAGVLAAVALGGRAGHPLHLLGLLGPVVATAWVVRRSSPGYGTALLRRSVDLRAVPSRWWAAVLAVGLAPPVIGAVAVGTGHAGSSASSGAAATGSGLGGLLAAVAFALAAGLVEEPAWRGVAQDTPVGRSWPVGAVVVGCLWTLWHLPLYVLPGTYQHGLGIGTVDFWLSMTARVPLAVLLAWLVHRTGGLVVAAVVAHAVGNAVGELLPGSTASSAVELVALTAGAVVVVTSSARRAGPP